ncbi:hypothetical protein [Carboxylicivirga linearis]|uniref:DUF1858 domain-containing protein n=1 Tax=Carboxylicivirga linearis TaxID=1628157 RepID=A0ABS5JUL3_9BACT|nr:hypothetical protein [Carboxylicivirga linearis]MBS2098528.1 hypothetical protein [Carboxylicivirga linearis]
MNKITKEINIENLIDLVPGAVRYLSEKGITCIACGEPVWGSLEEVAMNKGFSKEEIDQFVSALNKMVDNG